MGCEAAAAALSKAEFSRESERALPFLFDQVTRDQLVPFLSSGLEKKSKVVRDQLVPFQTFGSKNFLNLTKFNFLLQVVRHQLVPFQTFGFEKNLNLTD